jgi:hypothetical protein
MRKLLLLTCAAVCLLGVPFAATAGTFNAQGQFVGAVKPDVAALLAQFPAGGAGLRAAIAFLIETDPTLADDVVFAARGATSAQKEAIGLGVADAARFFALCTGVPRDKVRDLAEVCRGGEALVRQAMVFADPVTLAAFTTASSSNFAGDIQPTTPIFLPGIGVGTNCVSPNTPSC